MRLIVLCTAALCGLAAGDLTPLDPVRLAFAALVALISACLARRQPAWRWLALATCALALGALRAALAHVQDPASSALDAYVGQAVTLQGELLQPPTLSAASAQFPVEVRAAGPVGHEPQPLVPASPAGVRVRARVVGDPAVLGGLAAGATVLLEGRLLADDAEQRGPPTLLFPSLLDQSPPSPGDPRAVLGRARLAAEAGIHAYLPEPQASLASGVLLGGSGGLDAAFRLELQRSGLSHLVAIDGFKQVVVAAALGAVAVPLLGRRLAALPVGLGIVAYTLVTGAHPSAVRAALMLGLALLASLSGRVADPLTSVLVAVAVMAGVEPRVLLDVGLQLSLSAILGIVLLWPRWRRGLRGLPRWVAEPAGLTLAVTVATLPVTLSVFQLVSLVSPLAHVLAVPLLAPVLAGAALLAIAAPFPPLGMLVGWLTWVPTTALVGIIRATGQLPGAAVSTGHLPLPAAVGLAAALLAWGLVGLPEAEIVGALWARCQRRCGPWWMPLISMAGAAAALSVLSLSRPDGRLHVQTLAAGRGSAVFIRGPTGRTALVVGGHVDGALLASQVADQLAVWEHRLDDVIQLDASADTGLGLTLARYPPERRLDAAADMRIDLGGGAALDVYRPNRETSLNVAIAPNVAIVQNVPVAQAAQNVPIAQDGPIGQNVPIAQAVSIGQNVPVATNVPIQSRDAEADTAANAGASSTQRATDLAAASVSVSYGREWLPLVGQPPPPAEGCGD